MPFFSAIPQFFENLSKRKFSQEQTEALLDVITFVMVADGVTTPEEREQIERALGGVRWAGSDSPHDFVIRAEARLAESTSPHAFLERAVRVLDTEEIQDEVYYLAARMAGADKQLVAEETKFLHVLTQAFEIEGERLQLLTRRLIHEGHV